MGTVYIQRCAQFQFLLGYTYTIYIYISSLSLYECWVPYLESTIRWMLRWIVRERMGMCVFMLTFFWAFYHSVCRMIDLNLYKHYIPNLHRYKKKPLHISWKDFIIFTFVQYDHPWNSIWVWTKKEYFQRSISSCIGFLPSILDEGILLFDNQAYNSVILMSTTNIENV